MATPIQQLVLEFNKDKDNREFINYYKQKSYVEALGQARDEEAHSAFLAWLFKGEGFLVDTKDTPFMWLLHALILRDEINVIPTDLVEKVLTKELEYTIEEIKTEKKIKDIAPYFFSNNCLTQSPSEDELDIYIKCRLSGISGKDELEIFIENKVLSSEEGPKPNIARRGYDNLTQTERYYKACNSTSNKNKIQLFAYLTPPDADAPKSNQYIHFYYQDILDFIIEPLISTVPDTIKFRLEDYVNALSLPTLDVKDRKRIIMAISTEETRRIELFIERNEELLKEAAEAKIKQIQNMALTQDDNILLKFINANEPMFYAIKTYSSGSIDFTKNGNMFYSIGTNKEWVINISQSLVVLYKKEWMSKSTGSRSIPVLSLQIDSTNLKTFLQGNQANYTLNLEVGKCGTQAINWAKSLFSQLGIPYKNHIDNRRNVTYYAYGPFSYSPLSQCNIRELTNSVITDFENIASKNWPNIL